MLNANEAREALKDTNKQAIANAVTTFALTVEQEVKGAIKSGMSASRSIIVPKEISDPTLLQIKKGYEKLGYRVRVDHKLGYISTNLVREPKRILALFW